MDHFKKKFHNKFSFGLRSRPFTDNVIDFPGENKIKSLFLCEKIDYRLDK